MQKWIPGFTDPIGGLICGFRGFGHHLFGNGTAAPADGGAGWENGALFFVQDGAAGAQVYMNEGTPDSCDFNAIVLPGVSLSGLTATATELNKLDDTYAVLPTTAAAGITGGTGTIIETSVIKIGTIIETKILIDLTGLGSSTTDLDIIGQGASAAYLGQITAARNGTIFAGQMKCLETPAGGVTDIDLYSATEATGKFDDGIAALTETALVTSGGAWASTGAAKGFTANPAADQYLYLTGGAGGTAATYTAGIFEITLYGR